MSSAEAAQINLIEALRLRDYDFVPITPESQRRVLARPDRKVAQDLRDVFGWSLPFAEEIIDPEIVELMRAGGLIDPHPFGLISTVRVSRVHNRLFLHSAFPTEDDDSVFLGPDSWRFIDFIRAELIQRGSYEHLVDIGTGAGVGGISMAADLPSGRVELADINRKALGFARVNAASAGVKVNIVESDGLEAIAAGFDVAIANPPFIFEQDAPAYRRGGGMHGAELSRDWALRAAEKVAPGGLVLLYTGSPIVGGDDPLRKSLERRLPSLGCTLSWREIDPDIFGEELAKPAYADVERIAAIGAVIEKQGERP